MQFPAAGNDRTRTSVLYSLTTLGRKLTCSANSFTTICNRSSNSCLVFFFCFLMVSTMPELGPRFHSNSRSTYKQAPMPLLHHQFTRNRVTKICFLQFELRTKTKPQKVKVVFRGKCSKQTEVNFLSVCPFVHNRITS